MAPQHINITNVYSDIGSVYAGKSRAPEAFRGVGLQGKLEGLGFAIREATETPKAGWTSSSREPNGARNEARTVEACQSVSESVSSTLRRGNIEDTLHLILSGECLYMPAILSAYWHHLSGTDKTIGLIYIDADSDLHTPIDPFGSGNIAGMTLTHLTLRPGCLSSMKRFSRPDGSGVVTSDNIILFGLNPSSEANRREHLGWLLDHSFKAVTAGAVQESPVERAREALSWMEERVNYIIVHLDVDAIDPGEFPLCNVPNYTGLSFERCMQAVKVFLRSDKFVALSVAEVNPDHDPGLVMMGRLVDEIVDGFQGRTSAGGS